MNTIEAISSRYSIREYQEKNVPVEIINRILAAAIFAPSAKNRQPWKIIVIQGESKREFNIELTLVISKCSDITTIQTLETMRQAPVTIFICYDRIDYQYYEEEVVVWDMCTKDYEVVDILSLGALIQNIALAATDLGIATLWNCDIYYAYNDFKKWLNVEFPIVSAISLGYGSEPLPIRLRKLIDQVVIYK